jgi:hypothetical protein
VQKLEQEGLVRCLRIQNYNDAVTVLPDQSTDFRCFSCSDRRHYQHAGLQLTIDENGGHKFAYARDKGGDLSRLMQKGTRFFGHDLGVLMMLPAMACYTRDFLKYHNCGEYRDRFTKFGQLNKDLYLNDIY